jgi:hypothetical protein
LKFETYENRRPKRISVIDLPESRMSPNPGLGIKASGARQVLKIEIFEVRRLKVSLNHQIQEGMWCRSMESV